MKGVRFKRIVHSIKHFFKQNKNDILFGAGVVTEIGAVVMTAKATIKTKQMADIEAARIEQYVDEIDDPVEIKEANAESRRAIYRDVTKQTVKNYIVPAGLLLTSIGCYSKSHFDLKSQLASTTAALAAEHALNQKLLQGINPEVPAVKDENGNTVDTNAPYSGGIPNDLDNLVLDNAVLVWDNDTGYFAERDGYAEPTTIFLSPTCMTFKKDLYSDWTPNYDLNVHYMTRILGDTISRQISLYGFINLNDIRKHFCSGRSYKLEEAENYYLVYDQNKHMDNQVSYRIYAKCRPDGSVDGDCFYIDIFNTIVPKPGDLKEAKRRAIADNPFKEN